LHRGGHGKVLLRDNSQMAKKEIRIKKKVFKNTAANQEKWCERMSKPGGIRKGKSSRQNSYSVWGQARLENKCLAPQRLGEKTKSQPPEEEPDKS